MKCLCGCGEEVSKGCNFKRGHSNRVNHPRGMLGKKHSKETMKLLKRRPSWIKGLTKETDERVAKYSKLLKGRKRPDMLGDLNFSKTKEFKTMISGDNNPSKRPEVRQKISDSVSGKKNPMYGRVGKLNPAWKGGISCEPYCQDWTKEYKNYIKERDGHRCLNPDCWLKSKQLVVHHIDYDKKNCEQHNLITLCVSCNARANKNRNWHKDWYNTIIGRRYLYES